MDIVKVMEEYNIAQLKESQLSNQDIILIKLKSVNKDIDLNTYLFQSL